MGVTVGDVVRAGVMAAICLILATGCSAQTPSPSSTSVITSTTKIADAGVLGNQRRPDESFRRFY